MSFNKNVKLYRQNLNKSSNKEFYYTAINVYVEEAYQLSKDLLSGKGNMEDIRSKAQFLLDRLNVFSFPDKYNVYYLLQLIVRDATNFIINKNTMTMEKIYINQNTKIKNEYKVYMEKFGVPEDGIFQPNILEAIKRNML